MATTAAADLLDDDGINSTRALILGAYWMLRRQFAAETIGSAEIARWIRANEPDLPLPSPSLIQLTLEQAAVRRRPPGRPSKASCLPPFCPATEPRRRKRSRT